jgi:hypothetical protein
MPGALGNLTIILKTGTNLGKTFGPFSLNVAMISFVREKAACLVSPTARLLLHWTPLGFMVIGVMIPQLYEMRQSRLFAFFGVP